MIRLQRPHFIVNSLLWTLVSLCAVILLNGCDPIAGARKEVQLLFPLADSVLSGALTDLDTDKNIRRTVTKALLTPEEYHYFVNGVNLHHSNKGGNSLLIFSVIQFVEMDIAEAEAAVENIDSLYEDLRTRLQQLPPSKDFPTKLFGRIRREERDNWGEAVLDRRWVDYLLRHIPRQ
jgi:hypothetical protein